MPQSWHTSCQGWFSEADCEVRHPKLAGCTKRRVADATACGGTIVIEFQHSSITRDEVEARNQDYGHYCKRVIWVIDGNTGVRVKDLLLSNTHLLSFDESWKYASFITDTARYAYLECNGNVFRFAPSEVRSRMIDVHAGKPIADFVGALKAGTPDVLWDGDDALPQSTLFINQRGAGCGKTYESIQLLTNDARFAHKTTFIYLTKQHTAKTVIKDELVQQLHNAKLDCVPDSDEVRNVGRQWRIEFTRGADGEQLNIVVGTIDSFMYALGDTAAARAGTGDFFRNLRNSIKGGFVGYKMIDGAFRFASECMHLNKRCLLVVDEAQDLDPSYLEALAAIMRDTYIDVYVIGDKLQSILGVPNVFTCITSEALPHTNVYTSAGVNVVRRFHNAGLMDFVNRCVDFDKYGLSKIVGVCDGSGCSYVHDDADAVFRIEQPLITMYTGDAIIANFVDAIMTKVDDEVARQGYVPSNFMFVFPIMKENVLAERLETKLNEFWSRKFDDDAYRHDVLAADPYWRGHNADGFVRHAFLHKSDKERPINLEESRYSTRLLSIHASKGQGCEVVFLLNMTEATLKKFSEDTINLVYDSLLHVAITRSKKALYIGVRSDLKDDIHARFTDDGTHSVAATSLALPNESFKTSKIADFVASHEEWYERLDAAYFAPQKLHDAVPTPEGRGVDVIEWGHHVIRGHVMACTLLHEISKLTGGTSDDTSQLFAIVREIRGCTVKVLPHEEYYGALNDIAKRRREDRNDDRKSVLSIPILKLYGGKQKKYALHCDETLATIVRHVQKKLRSGVPMLCPIEMCALVHVQLVLHNGQYTPFNITEMYDILSSMARAPDMQHDGYDCLCNTHLCDGAGRSCGVIGDEPDTDRVRGLRTNVANHHLATAKVAEMFAGFNEHLRKALGDTTRVTFNIEHIIVYNGNTNFFKTWMPIRVIATTEHNVVLFMQTPSFTWLTRSGVFVQALLDTFVALNSKEDSKNHVRFHGKRVSVCVFTFSSVHPVWLHLDDVVTDDDTPIRDCIAASLMRMYRPANAMLWEKFQEYLRISSPRVHPAFQLMEAKLNDAKPKVKYVDAFFDKVKSLSKEAGRCVVQGVQDFDAELEMRVREWLNGSDDETW